MTFLSGYFSFIENKLEVVEEDFFDVLGETGCEIITNNYRWFYEAFEYEI